MHAQKAEQAASSKQTVTKKFRQKALDPDERYAQERALMEAAQAQRAAQVWCSPLPHWSWPQASGCFGARALGQLFCQGTVTLLLPDGVRFTAQEVMRRQRRAVRDMLRAREVLPQP